MTQENLPFFKEPTPTISGALKALANAKIAAPAYLQVVRQVTAAMSVLPPERLVIVAVPNANVGNWLGEAVADYYTQQRIAENRAGSVALIDLPSAWTGRERQRAILAAYIGIPMTLVHHSYRPQFELELGAPYSGISLVHQVYSVVTSQRADCYILRNAEKLADESMGIQEEIERVKFFVDLSRETGKRHVLITQAEVAAQWLESAELTTAVQQFWIAPYSQHQESFAEFRGIRAGFDMRIPREPGFALKDHAEDVHRAVWGCPTRAKLWVERVLTHFSNTSIESLNWDHFLELSPRKPEIDGAKAEYDMIAKATVQPLRLEWQTKSGSQETDNAESTRKRKRRVGRRALGRDPVAQPDEHAA